MKLFLAGLLPYILCFPLFAQTSIVGTLVDANENTPIEYGSVGIYTNTDSSLVSGAVTEPDGKFELSGIKPGNYYLLIQFMGYNSLLLDEITLNRGQMLDLGTMTLSPNEQLLEMVEVSGTRFTTMHQIDRQVFESSEFMSGQGARPST